MLSLEDHNSHNKRIMSTFWQLDDDFDDDHIVTFVHTLVPGAQWISKMFPFLGFGSLLYPAGRGRYWLLCSSVPSDWCREWTLGSEDKHSNWQLNHVALVWRAFSDGFCNISHDCQSELIKGERCKLMNPFAVRWTTPFEKVKRSRMTRWGRPCRSSKNPKKVRET